MGVREEAARVSVDGLPEGLRSQVSKAYRAMGGTWAAPDVGHLRVALRAVRRREEVAGRWRAADELTRREDVIEMLPGGRSAARGLGSGHGAA